MEIDRHAQFRRQQFGHVRLERGGDAAHGPQFEQLGQDVAGGHADGLGETPHRAGQHDDHVFAPRRRRVGPGPADVRASPHRRRAALLLVLFGLPPPNGGGLLAFQLPLLAAAEGNGPFFLFFDHGGTAAAARTLPPAGRRLAGRGGSLLRRRPLAGRSLGGLGRQPFLLVFADVLGERLRARLAGADGVQGKSDVRLLRGRLGCFWPLGRPRRGRQGGQLDRRPSLSFLPLFFFFPWVFPSAFSLCFSALLRSFAFSLRPLGARGRGGGAGLRLGRRRSGFSSAGGASRAWRGRTGTLPGTVPAGAM